MNVHKNVSIVLAVCLTLLLVTGSYHLWRTERYSGLSPVCRVTTNQKVIGLSFDDGPDPTFTPNVLSLINGAGVHATFFVVGERATMSGSLIATELSEGNEIGNHTWSHPNLASLSDALAASQIDETNKVLSADDAVPTLFRAPYGTITPSELRTVRKQGLQPIGWTFAIDHFVDGLHLSAQQAAQLLATEVRPGDILLAHDAGGVHREEALSALSMLIPKLQQRGYVFTTVSTVLQSGKTIRSTPRTWPWQSGFSCSRGPDSGSRE